MLRKVDLVDSVLIAYLQTVNPSMEIGVLLAKGVTSTSKRTKNSKKVIQASPSKSAHVSTPKKVTKASSSNPNPDPIQQEVAQPIPEETAQPKKVAMPSKSGVLKRLKKMDHRPRHSPERLDVEAVSEKFLSSTRSISFSMKIRKPQINRKGVTIHEIPASVSPTSKK